jgi:cytochrome c556
MRTSRLLLAAGLAAAAALPATAQDDPLAHAIEARQGYFTLLGTEIGPLAQMAKGEMEYDAERASAHAANLAALAGYDPARLFPEGSSKFEREGDTRALATIWDDMDGFMAAMQDFVEAANALPEVAGQGRAELAGGVGRVGDTCGACHDDYRAEDF